MYKVQRVDTWMTEVDDRVGGLRDMLGNLAKIGVDLEFLIARRTGANPRRGLLFVSPIHEAQAPAAEQLGLHRSQDLHTLRIVGDDQPGLAFLIAQAVSAMGINIRGVSAAVLGGQFTMYLAFDNEDDAHKAQQRLSAWI